MFEHPRNRGCPLESTSSVICDEECGGFVGAERFVAIMVDCED